MLHPQSFSSRVVFPLNLWVKYIFILKQHILQQVKPLLVHLTHLLAIVLYLLAGALLFHYIEKDAPGKRDNPLNFYTCLLFSFTLVTTIGKHNGKFF